MGDLTVGVVATSRAWRSELQAYVRNHVSGIRLIVLREPRTAFEEHLDAVVVDDVASFLNRMAVKRLRERGVSIVGVYDPDEDDGVGQRFLQDLGVDLMVTAGSTAEDLLREIAVLGPAGELQGEVEEYLATLEPGTVAAGPPADGPTAGPTKGPLWAVADAGASAATVGAAIAQVLARRTATVVVDVDEVRPELARLLRYALEPNLLSALDALRHGGDIANHLARRSNGTLGRISFDAIVGLPNVADWSQARDNDLVALLDELRARWRTVVALVGPHLEELEGMGPERFAVSRAAVAAATDVIGVAPAGRLGVMRLLDWAAQVEDLAGPRPLWAVFTDSPASSFKRAEIEERIRENISPELVSGIVFLPPDPRVSEADWDGAPIGSGRFIRAVGALVDQLMPKPVIGKHRR